MNEYSQMVADLAKPGEDIIATLTPIKMHALHMAVGLMGEVTELSEHRLLADDSKEHSSSTVLEELGDIEFYFEGLCQSMRLTVPESGAKFPYPLSIDNLVVTAGEMLDLVKKMVIYNKDIELFEFVNGVIAVRKTLDQVYSYYELTQVQAREHNMHKLLKGKNARYGKGTYSDEASINRVDKAES